MNVLLTGAFGNLGQSTLRNLAKAKHCVTCFDLLTNKNLKIAKQLLKEYDFKTIFGDILEAKLIAEAIKNQDCIIHLAGITPPLTEKKPELAYRINVEGTKNILKEAKKQKKSPMIIFPSSISIYGPQTPDLPPRTAKHPINPSDVYTKTKAEVEKIIQESGLLWTIFRITAVPSLSLRGNEMSLLYEMPMEQKIEFAHTRDIGLALATAITAQTEGKIMMLGGGVKSQYTNRDFLTKYFTTLGIGMLPEAVFREPRTKDDWYYTNWLDTEESQKLLKYQHHTLDDFLEEIQEKLRFSRLIVFILRPFIRKYLIRKSPYYKINSKRKQQIK
ncbi:MAG: NAD(P)-dependent oxidoreductase [Candidatus Heimdallarchaeota archaeon]|nr:NAD(P)-dependent oxidoreductase [Candidatus Heimdallarchaeota archaeon]MCK4770345.1 NAD(P)-dependent oxidoreductase [Candidatus Heimdallarchaeota archaeon]